MIKRLFSIWLFVLVFASVAMQGQTLDESMSRISKSENLQFEQLLDSARFYLKIDADLSIQYVEESLRKLNDKKTRSSESAISYILLGDIYHHWKAYDLAASNYEIALKSVRPSEEVLSAKLKLADSYFLDKKYNKSNDILFSLRKERKMVPEQKVRLFELLGDNHRAQGDRDQAMEFYNDGLKIAEKRDLADKVIDLNTKIGEIYAQRGDTGNAEKFYNNSIDVAQQQSIQQEVVQNQKMADYYRSSNQLDKEINLRKSNLEKVESLPEKAVDTLTTQSLNFDLADAYVSQKRYVEAIPYLNKSIEVASQEKDLETEKNALQRLSEVYKNVGDFDNALESYQKYVDLVDILYQQKEKELQDVAEFNKALALQQNRINILEKDRELSENKIEFIEKEQRLTEESNRRQRYIIYSLIAGLMLLVVTVFMMYKSIRQRKLTNNLLALKSLRTQMNPHFIFNALNSVNSFIAQSDERAANKYLTDFSTLMRAVLENSEKDFIPLSREIELISLYLKLEHARFKEKFDYTFEVADNIDIDAFEIPPMLLQPYIENAVWHGLRYKKNKGLLEVKLAQKDTQTLLITITDDGIGRTKSKALKTQNQLKQKSKGMGNVSSRIAILNEMYQDKLSVEVSDLFEHGEGTRVQLLLKR
jgi:tetratricopeptide (TPR) repeat protein